MTLLHLQTSRKKMPNLGGAYDALQVCSPLSYKDEYCMYSIFL